MQAILRELSMDDAPELARILNNPMVQDNLREMPFPYTQKDAEWFLQNTLEEAPGKNYLWAIDIEGKIAGCVGIHRQDNVHRLTAEIGYYLAETYWGKGIMTATVKEACKRVFDTTDIVRIYGDPYSRNAASCRVLEKAGFVFEGTLRKNAIRHGKLLDMKMYALVR